MVRPLEALPTLSETSSYTADPYSHHLQSATYADGDLWAIVQGRQSEPTGRLTRTCSGTGVVKLLVHSTCFSTSVPPRVVTVSAGP
jgi:hypothetical protein